MSSITAVELGADTCALARTSVRNGEIRLFVAEILDPRQFPGADALATALRQSRRTLRLPRRCRAVVWGIPEGTGRRDPVIAPALQPLITAGFKIERVVSPCNALAALARLKTSRGDGATCWLAVNRGGVAIVVVRPGEQLYGHSFVWDSSIGSVGSQARLLQRYSLVSALAPEVRRAMAAAIEKNTRVDAIVTCGNLPDLRSLTMPLIEELDIEVETLDSLEGLEVAPEAADRLAEIAPAIRLACAGTIARGTRAWDVAKRRQHHVGRWIRAAALVAAIGAAAYLWYMNWTAPALARRPTIQRGDSRTPKSQNTPRVAPAASPNGGRGAIAPAPAVRAPAPAATVSSPATTVAAKRPEPSPPMATAPATKPPVVHSPAPALSAPAAESKPPAVRKPAAAASNPPRPESRPPAVNKPAPAASNPPRPEPKAPVVRGPAPAVTAPPQRPQPNPKTPESNPRPLDSPPPIVVLQPPVGVNPGGLNTPSAPADKAEAGPRAGRMPAPLKDPVPRLTAILVSNDRRYATIEGGLIVGVGDRLGPRVVVDIDERTMVLREPSGVQIRVGLGGRLVGIPWFNR